MMSEISVKDRITGVVQTVSCEKLMAYGNDPAYVAIIQKQMYRKMSDGIYEYLGEVE